MRKEKVERLMSDIDMHIDYSEAKWDSGESHAFIVGYLQQALRNLKSDLEWELPLEKRSEISEKK